MYPAGQGIGVIVGVGVMVAVGAMVGRGVAVGVSWTVQGVAELLAIEALPAASMARTEG